jgi:predicted outer membrane lipoprotein
VKTVRWVAGFGIPPAAIQRELDAALGVLRALSLEHVTDMPANLSAYVRDIFPEIGP